MALEQRWRDAQIDISGNMGRCVVAQQQHIGVAIDDIGAHRLGTRRIAVRDPLSSRHDDARLDQGPPTDAAHAATDPLSPSLRR